MSDEHVQPRLRRTWPQRLMIITAAGLSVVAFVVAGLVWFTQQRLEERQFVVLDDATASEELAPLTDEAAAARPASEQADTTDGEIVEEVAPVETFPEAEPSARNFLITGADNNSCIDPDSRFAPAFGDRTGLGERSDTIMIWRINPSASDAAILSFPRDLWVDIDGRSSPDRINTAYVKDDPQRLINTIRQNFGIETDHFVQIDFCAFKTLVDAVDGVAVPFEYAVRDVATGLFVPEPGCYTFEGDHALAYVRSRKIEYFDEAGRWQRDGTSDLGRISRQQDFIERIVDELIANALSPSVVRGLFETNREYVVTDDQLTLDRLLEFAGVVQRLDSSTITTYQIQASPRVIGSNSVLVPQTGGPNMQAVLAIFQGRATLADGFEQEDDEIATDAVATTAPLPTTSTTAPRTTDTVIDPETGRPAVPATADSTTTTTTEPSSFETVEVEAEEIVFGVVPDGAVRCP